ncbi:MAG: cell division protein CrgA [Acidimicrobiales bacterium]
MPDTSSGDSEPPVSSPDTPDADAPAAGEVNEVEDVEDLKEVKAPSATKGPTAPSATKGPTAPAATKGPTAPAATKGPKATNQATASGRATPKGGSPRAQAPKPGRYTPPIPKQVRRSPSWYPYVLLTFLIGGLLMIVLNYIHVLPGGTNNWYLLGGIAFIVTGLFMATRYH